MKRILSLVFISIIGLLSAQISGKIVDKKGKPYSDISINKKGSQLKTYTNEKGEFEISAKIGDTIIINNKYYKISSNPLTLKVSGANKIINIDEVVLKLKKTESPQSIEIDKKSINISRGSSNGDIFNGIPGLQVNNIRNEAGAVDIGIRGLQGEGRVPVLIDGSLQSVHTDRGYQGSSDRTYIEMDLVKQIKVDKGASFSNSATGATGGTVEMKTIDAEDIVKKGKQFGVYVKGTLQNNGKYPKVPENENDQIKYALSNGIKETQFNNGSATVALGYKGKKFDFLSAVSIHTQGNYFAGKKGAEKYGYEENKIYRGNPVIRPEQEVVNTSYTSQSGLMKFGWQIGNYQRINLNYRYHYQRAGEVLAAYWYKSNENIEEDMINKKNETMPQWTTGTTIINSYSADYRYNRNKFVDLNVSLFANTGYFKQYNGLPVFKGKFQGAQYLHEYENNRKGILVLNKTSFTLPFPLVLSYGINIQNERNYPIRPRKKKLGAARNGERSTQSIFLSGVMQLGKFSFQTNLSRDYAAVSDFAQDRNIYYGNKISTTAQIVYHPFNQISLYAKGYNVYRSPSLYESTESNQSFNYNPAYPLKQENTEGIELGFKTNFSELLGTTDKLTFGANGFYNNTKNYISAAALNKMEALTFINYDSFLLKGVELNAKYNFPSIGYLNASAIFYSKSTVCSEIMGKEYNIDKCTPLGFAWSLLPTRIPPKKSLLIDAGMYALKNKLMLGGTLKYHSGKEYPQDWLAGTGATGMINDLPADTVINVYGEYQYNESLKATFGIDNITNRYKYDPGSILSMPIPGRTIRVGIEAKF